MDRESAILRQEVDCNCNDCRYFVRSIDALNASKKLHRQWSFLGIRTRRRHFWDEAQKALGKGKLESYRQLLRERSNVMVDKSYKAGLVFGNCSKYNLKIETVPNVCQVETQQCFAHRRRHPDGSL